jgi:2-polyprenyl-6-methoxyphenol hydroxylase-like FAD-dependent oxidoreductase
MKITIVGAGIGGLTTAIALKQKGFEIELFEAAPQFNNAGSGINLAINAMLVYKELGLYDTIFEAGSHTNSMIITDSKLRTLSSIDLMKFEEKFNVKSVAIHRAKLHQILRDQLTDVPIYLNKKTKVVRQLESGIEIEFEDGTIHKSEVLIGSDGIHSIIRKSIFKKSNIRKAKQICWRGIAKIELDEKYQTELNESWGKAKRFGFVAISKNQYYWYALANYKENYQEEFKNINLEEFYSKFHPTIRKILKSTPKENQITNEIFDLKPISNWYKKNICLLGDSAHATTPNLGQGACQAIESSLVIANCLAKHKSPEIAFKAFQELRISNAHKVVKKSWMIGKIAHLSNPVLIGIRNKMFQLAPSSMNRKQLNQMFQIQKS